MRRALALGLLLLCLSPGGTRAQELLSPEDLAQLQPAYEAFLDVLEQTLQARGLLEGVDAQAWRAAQLGDFLSNGAYGSFLISYQPGALDAVREEDIARTLSCSFPFGVLYLSTLRRYTPAADAKGLLLSFSLKDASELPVSAAFELTCTEGLFSRWNALSEHYQAVGPKAISEGEALLWSAPVPAMGAADPQMNIVLYHNQTGERLGKATLRLRVSQGGYVLDEDALLPLE